MVKLIIDSAGDIDKERAQQLDISIVAMSYTLDGTTYYRDGIDYSNNEFFELLETTKAMPKTSQVPIDHMVNEFTANVNRPIIMVTMSSVASGTYQAAQMARNLVLELHPTADITIIDSGLFTILYGDVVCKAAQLALQDKSKQDIIQFITQDLKRINAYFVTETLDYLIAGGRIKGAQAFLATVLDIKPVMTIADGFVKPFDKIRGTKKLFTKMVSLMKRDGIDLNGQDIYVVHTCQPLKAEQLKETVLEQFAPSSISYSELGATIGSHTGRGLFGVTFRR